MEKAKKEEAKLKKTFGIEDSKKIEGSLKDIYKTAYGIIHTEEDDVALQYMQIVLNGAELYNKNEIRNIFITVKSDTRGLNFPSGGIEILLKQINNTPYFAIKK
ncbi:MAG: hypothetical protein PHU12_00720 [Candidatus Aenigmarchaeota archaeon]|nr:hypothetical protein [Candidatus Aenigmarchaeota archaeon]